MQLVRGDEARLEQPVQVGLGVERVLARQADEVRRARQPVVRAELVLLVNGDLDAAPALRRRAPAVVFLEAVDVVLFVLERAQQRQLLRRVLVREALVLRLALAVAGGIGVVVLVLVRVALPLVLVLVLDLFLGLRVVLLLFALLDVGGPFLLVLDKVLGGVEDVSPAERLVLGVSQVKVLFCFC